MTPRFAVPLFALILAPLFSLPVAADRLPDFADLVDDEYRAVVNISTARSIDPREGGLPPGFSIPDDDDRIPEDLLRRFFGEERGGPPMPDENASLGSGFIISEDGYVLTNTHVVQGADTIIVRLHDRRQYEAEVIGVDERSDVALLRVDAEDLPTVRIGDPQQLRVGGWVLAIGSPFGFDHSVTAGIVSAKQRSLPNDNYVPFIQTDVAINPGNSGGPLFNLDGEVVGVNAQIFSRTGGFMGLSFAIPIDVAMEVADQLRVDGRVVRGWLGVVIQEVTRELAQSFDMDRAEGALVARVLEGSPSEAAGLQPGDVIVRYDGRDVPRSSALPPMVGRTPTGTEVEVDIIREGSPRTVMVEIGELPDDPDTSAPEQTPDEPAEAEHGRLGMSVEPVPAEIRRELGVDEGGVMVTDLAPGPARNAGVRVDDVITMFDSEKVTGVDDFKARVERLEAGDMAALLVQRAEGSQFIAIELPEDGE